MSKSLTTAVILAAGLGSRLGEKSNNKPKAFLEIGGQTLVERSIITLTNKGINKIIIGTGHLNHFFDALCSTYPQVRTKRNDEYASTGSMYTLYNLSDLIHESFLLLEGDLLYEPAALDHLISDSSEDVILASDATNSGDEVYIQCSKEGYLQTMGKNKSALQQVDAELIGICKLSLSTFQEMVKFADENYRAGKKEIHYEDALVGISSHKKIKVKIVEDLAWCEIDDEQHLSRALSDVYPKLISRSTNN